MQLMKVAAKDLELGDILGEGQEISMKVTSIPPENGKVDVYFGRFQDWRTKIEFHPEELVNVLRGPRIPLINSDDYAKGSDNG